MHKLFKMSFKALLQGLNLFSATLGLFLRILQKSRFKDVWLKKNSTDYDLDSDVFGIRWLKLSLFQKMTSIKVLGYILSVCSDRFCLTVLKPNMWYPKFVSFLINYKMQPRIPIFCNCIFFFYFSGFVYPLKQTWKTYQVRSCA